MISKDMLQHQLWTIGIGYRPHHTEVKDLINSHLEALAEIKRLKHGYEPDPEPDLLPTSLWDFGGLR